MLSIFSYLVNGQFLAALVVILTRCFVVFCCLPIHEIAHAYTAHLLGDDTAKAKGRLTFNPLAHLNPIGTIMLFLFGFGYADPVPVNPRNLHNPKRDMALISLSGPVTNLLLATISIWIYYILYAVFPADSTFLYAVSSFFYYSAEINVFLAVFNFLPIPPLDGSKIFASVLPTKFYYKYMKYERYVIIAVFVLLLTGVLDNIISLISDFFLNIIGFVPYLIFG